MAMAISRADITEILTEDRERPLAADPHLRALVARRDDRLLRDAGLTREEVLGPQGYFWSDWRRLRAPWSL